MSDQPLAYTARIISSPRDNSIEVVGTGFLVSAKHVITCAHVVIEALNIQDEECAKKQPTDKVYLNLVADSFNTNYSARVICWCPPQQFGKRNRQPGRVVLEDVAVLELDEAAPEDILFAHCLLMEEELTERRFHAYGFPDGYGEGVSSEGEILDSQANEWIKLGSMTRGVPIEGGFSGAAVWSEEIEGIIGMIVMADDRPDRRVAFAIPTKQLLAAWPGLEKYIDYLHPITREFREYLRKLSTLLTQLPPYYPEGFDFHRVHRGIRVSQQRLFYEEEEKRVREVVSLAERQEHEEQAEIIYQWRGTEMYEQEGKREVTEAVAVDWEAVRTDVKHIVILGDPGFGKSWLLRYEGQIIALNQLEKLEKNELRIETVEFPVFLRLGSLAEELTSTNVREAIARALTREYHLSDRFLKYVRRWLNGTQCVFLLDALDEVAENRRIGLREALRQLSEKNESRIVLTSRIVGYQGIPFVQQSGKWKQELKLVRFDHEQVVDFIETWFGKNRAGRQLLNSLRLEPSLRSMARIPILLSFLCAVTWRHEDIPTRHTELYETMLWYLLEERNAERDVLEGRVALLELVAWHFATLNGYWHDVMPVEELDEVIRKGVQEQYLTEDTSSPHALLGRLSAMLIKAGESRRSRPKHKVSYLFLHRTFHEYLVARYLAAMPVEEWTKLIRPHLWFDADWVVIIMQLAGCLSDPNPLLEMLLSEPYDTFHAMLFLSGHCLTEADRLAVRPEITERIVTRLLKVLYSLSDQDRAQASSVLAKIGEPTIEGLLAILFSEERKMPIYVRAAAVQTLGQMGRSRATEGLLKAFLIKDEKFRGVREDIILALGRCGTPQAIDELLTLLEKEKSYAQQEIRQIAPLSGGDEGRLIWDAQVALEALGECDDERAVDALLSVVRSGSSSRRRMALNSLRKIGDKRIVDALLTIVRDTERKYLSFLSIRETIAQALEQLSDPVLAETLLAALRTAEANSRIAYIHEVAVLVFGQVGDPAVDELLSHLPGTDAQGYNPYERWNASLPMLQPREKAVVNAGADLEELLQEIWNTLITELETEEQFYLMRAEAAQTLGQIGNSRAVEGLIEILQHKERGGRNWYVRWAVAGALGQIGDPRAVETLRKVLLDEEYLQNKQNQNRYVGELRVREAAVRALGKIGDPRAVDVLLDTLQQHTDDPWQDALHLAAIEALGQLGDSRVATTLRDIALSAWSSPPLRDAATKALVLIANQQTVWDLLNVLRISSIHSIRHFFSKVLEEQKPLVDALVEVGLAEADHRLASGVAERIIMELGYSGNPRVKEALLEAQRDKNRRIHKAVKKPLNQYDEKLPMRAIAVGLRDKNGYFRRLAFEALGRFSNARAVEALLSGLREGQQRSRIAASLETLADEGEPKMFCRSILHAWSYLGLDDDTRIFLYELLMQSSPRLHAATGEAWFTWRAHLIRQTNYVLNAGLKGNIDFTRFIDLVSAVIAFARLVRHRFLMRNSQHSDDDTASEEREDLSADEAVSARTVALGLESRSAGWLCYLFGWVTGLLFFFLGRKNHFVRFHAIQSMLVFGCINIMEVVCVHLPYANLTIRGLGLLSLICWILLMSMARVERYFKVPLIGHLARKLADRGKSIKH